MRKLKCANYLASKIIFVINLLTKFDTTEKLKPKYQIFPIKVLSGKTIK